MIQNGFSSFPNVDLRHLAAAAACAYGSNSKEIVTYEASACALPPERRFLVMAGTEEIRDLLLGLRFTKDDIGLIREFEPFRTIMKSSNFERYLEDFRFAGDLWAMAEGQIVFAGEPLVRVTATVPEAVMAESCVLPVLNHTIPVASKAARMVLAARGKTIVDAGTDRMHVHYAASAARAAYLVGFSATSNVAAILRYGIPPVGAMLHPWILLYEREDEAFMTLCKACRESVGIAIDTNDVWDGTTLAADRMQYGEVVIESGDPVVVAGGVRKLLDARDRHSIRIVAAVTDEFETDRIRRACAPIDGFLVTGGLDSQCREHVSVTYDVVYNDTAQKPLAWISSGHAVLPGRKQVFLDQRNGGWSHLVALESSVVPDAGEDLVPLLDRHISGGEPCEDSSIELEVARRYCNAELLGLSQRPSLSSLEPKTEEDVPVYPHQDLKDLFDLAMSRMGRQTH